MRRLALGVLVAACASCALPPAPPAPRALAWRDCDDGFECAELAVPLDHAAPDASERVSLALLRRRATGGAAQRIGSLVINPGGPGISALDHLRLSHTQYGDVLRRRFDLVAFDARGTGASARLDCHASLPELMAQDPDATSEPAFASAAAASRALAEECRAKHGALLPHMGTGASARDLERLRAALGDERLSYLGFSYGSALGAVYASLFPERVRALVLDGAIDPGFELLRFAREQAAAVERALVAYDAEAQRRGWHGADALAALQARADLESHVLYGAVEGLVSPPEGWRELSAAIGAAQLGDSNPLLVLADRYFGRAPDGSTRLSIEAQLATLCADLVRPVSTQGYRDALPSAAEASPHFGVANTLSLLPCAFWPAPAHPLDPVRAVPEAPILVLGGTRDPLTPHVWAERLAAALGTPAFLSVDTDRHTAFGKGDPCVDGRVTAFLETGEAPRARARCPTD